MKTRKTSASDLKNYYTLFLQSGLVLTLLLFIGAVKLDLRSSAPQEYAADEQEIFELDDIVRTEQIDVVPPPPVDPPPVAVPEDEIIEEADINFSADIDFGNILDLPPRPDAAEEEEDIFFHAVEIKPELIGGLAGLLERIDYPDAARRANLEDRVILNFVVDEEGNVTNAEVLSGNYPMLNEEALRVMRESKFTPGIQAGRPVKVRMGMPIEFRLRR